MRYEDVVSGIFDGSFFRVFVGDCVEELKSFPDGFVHAVMTSPPYFSLRVYGSGSKEVGLEDSVDEYLDKIVSVGKEIYRVLRDDGVFWLNIDDTVSDGSDGMVVSGRHVRKGELLGVPFEMVRRLTREAGFILLQDIIWEKTGLPPRSVKSKPVRNHEYIFMFSKCVNPFYDWFGVREKSSSDEVKLAKRGYSKERLKAAKDSKVCCAKFDDKGAFVGLLRKMRTVWLVPNNRDTSEYAGHFARYPVKLCMKALRSSIGVGLCCSGCGRLVERKLKRVSRVEAVELGDEFFMQGLELKCRCKRSCCDDVNCVSCRGLGRVLVKPVVLDPFSGSGSTGVAALRCSVRYVGIELNEDFAGESVRRLEGEMGLF